MLTGSVAIACGDAPLCPGETILLIDPAPITVDSNPIAPGVQHDVVIRTSLAVNREVTLEVSGIDGSVVSLTGTVDTTHTVVFEQVALPAPKATLRVQATDELCGDAVDEVTIDVLVGGNCAMTLSPMPQPNAFYAPLPVLDRATDLDPAPGHQATVGVQTAAAALVEVFASGPAGDVSLGTMTTTGATALVDVTLPEGQITLRATCTVAGTTLATPATTVFVDTVAPTCALTAPVADTPITPEQDLDDSLDNGIQLVLAGHVDGTDVSGEPVAFTLTETGGPPQVIAGSAVDGLGATSAPATLAPAATPTAFTFALAARDHAGNPCTASADHPLLTTFVSFAAPAADGEVSGNDGAVAGNTLTFPLCGSVTRDNAAVSVTIDSGPPIEATVTGRIWCATITVSETPPAHAIVATATVGADVGVGTLSLAVDVTPPAQISAFTATAVNRQRIEITWTAPGDGGGAAPAYVARLATVPLTETNFDTTGVVLATSPPAQPGTAESLAIVPARTGTTFFFGIAAVDRFGNRARAAISGPLQPVFDQTGAITPPDADQGLLAFGSAIAHGRFNDDDFEDVAIGAPNRNDGTAQRAGAVYVYFGDPQGIRPTPDLIIKGEVAQGRFGAGLAALSRSSATRDDLVVGSPGGDGKIFVYDGGAALGTGTRLASTATVVIRVDATNPGFFAASALGSRVVTADVDGDGSQDVVASAPGGDGGKGGAELVYRCSIGTDVALSDLDPTGSGTTITELVRDPGAGSASGLGFYLWSVGKTEGPLDRSDDLVLVYQDDQTTGGDSLYVFRGDGTRPLAPGVTPRPFAPSRDVRIDFVTATIATDWGSAAATIEDQDGDGARELVVSAYRQNRTLVITGDVTAPGGVVTTADAGVVRTTINGGTGVSRMGAAIPINDGRSSGDIDGDGKEDLVIGGTRGGTAMLFVWFGGAIPTGTVTASSAGTTVLLGAPNAWRAPGRGNAGVASWIADINGDGLDDLCVASPVDNASDGLFEVLWDELP